ncbi:glycoside hydrolase family 36 protein [Paenibacillus donghaensis]|uniref:Alpha-galactosidase n=1 Tax=Paenibacillus donghaensis TaxID=414771 RepID=A0A2Z2KCJ7_9BACL|nr:glycoside hydrolase family 36 protein [Paenibacillus donghaensis]ASA19679.1 alpha-galactosidase [Paenibacillus donghaensis]
MSAARSTLHTGTYTVVLDGDTDVFRPELSFAQEADGLQYIRLVLQADHVAVPPAFTLRWSQKALDVQGLWHPVADRNRALIPDWWPGFSSRATSSAPVVCLYGGTGHNVLSFACSDVLNPLQLHAGLHEESASFDCRVTLFAEPCSPLQQYELTLRLDARRHPYYEALQEVSDWWASLEGCRPAPVPETAREPMYSTWYSFHQQLEPEAVEEQCRIAAQLGCKAVIIDDGWQTSDESRGYAYCGDWAVSPAKLPEMKHHVARVHQLGLKYLLWYAVPFIGKHSMAWSRFGHKLLYMNEELGAGIVDPRFPEVREYLTAIYEQALLDWDLDGFKLDFVDSFYADSTSAARLGDGRDTDSVPEAVDLLLSGIISRLKQLKPGIMIEFRQNYIGPLMRKYGNIFRAADCPGDALQNRIKTIDIRLLGGGTAAHADMLMWHPEETAEHAALQLLNVLFAVPQISMLLNRIPTSQFQMLFFWLTFWREHRDVLLDGKLAPQHPELLYPLVLARTPYKLAAAAYQDTVIPLAGELPEQVYIVNGTLLERLVVELDQAYEGVGVKVQDCRGAVVREELVNLGKGVHMLEVPAAGLITLRMANE